MVYGRGKTLYCPPRLAGAPAFMEACEADEQQRALVGGQRRVCRSAGSTVPTKLFTA